MTPGEGAEDSAIPAPLDKALLFLLWEGDLGTRGQNSHTSLRNGSRSHGEELSNSALLTVQKRSLVSLHIAQPKLLFRADLYSICAPGQALAEMRAGLKEVRQSMVRKPGWRSKIRHMPSASCSFLRGFHGDGVILW